MVGVLRVKASGSLNDDPKLLSSSSSSAITIGVVGIGEDMDEEHSLDDEQVDDRLPWNEGVFERWYECELEESVEEVLWSRLGGVRTGRVGIGKWIEVDSRRDEVDACAGVRLKYEIDSVVGNGVPGRVVVLVDDIVIV